MLCASNDDRVFLARVQVKRTALMLVAYRSHPDETKGMRDAFKAYDVDRNGRVSRAEFQNVLKKQGYTDSQVRGKSLLLVHSCSCSSTLTLTLLDAAGATGGHTAQ